MLIAENPIAPNINSCLVEPQVWAEARLVDGKMEIRLASGTAPNHGQCSCEFCRIYNSGGRILLEVADPSEVIL